MSLLCFGLCGVLQMTWQSRRLVLGDIWDVDGKRAYLDALEKEKVLPTAEHTLTGKEDAPTRSRQVAAPVAPSRVSRPQRRTTLIPNMRYPIAWAGRLQRHRAIWEELQFFLNLNDHPNAISVLIRVLIELSVENYIAQTKLQTIKPNDSLAKRVLRVAEERGGPTF